MKRSKRPHTLSLGSYSSGTMRPEDLIPTFLDAIEGIKLSKADRAIALLAKLKADVRRAEKE